MKIQFILTCIYWRLVLVSANLTMAAIAAVSNKLLFFWKKNLRTLPTLLWWWRFVHEKKKENLMKTLNGLYYPTREQKQANQFILFLSTYNAKSIFPKQNTAQTIPVVQLCKSNAIIGQLPMSTFPTWTPRQSRHCLVIFMDGLTVRFKILNWTNTASSQTNHPIKKLTGLNGLDPFNTEDDGVKCRFTPNLCNKKDFTFI